MDSNDWVGLIIFGCLAVPFIAAIGLLVREIVSDIRAGIERRRSLRQLEAMKPKGIGLN